MTSDAIERPEETEPTPVDPAERKRQQGWMALVSLVIVAIVLWVSFVRGPLIFCPRGDDLTAADPYTLQVCGLPPELEMLLEGGPPEQREGELAAEYAERERRFAVAKAASDRREALVAKGGKQDLRRHPNWSFLEPYLANLAGVLLFILSVGRSKGPSWNFRGYFGVHAFRIAQSMAYLFLILWAWPAIGSQQVVTARLGPHVLGFLVGLYIRRVERVMASLGERFEDILASALPMALDYEAPGDRARKRLRTTVKLEDIETQWEALRPQVDDPGAQVRVDGLIAEIRKARAAGKEAEAEAQSTRLFAAFEEIKRRAGEVLIPIDELIDR